MGEKSGVAGVELRPALSVKPIGITGFVSFSAVTGKLSHVDVTRTDFSTARRYFPTDLYWFLG
jgi:hypothetical protein